MSEIQSNQQQVETTEHTQVAQIQSVVFNQPEKVEETVALEISQLGGSSIISSEASHSVEHDVSKISSEGIDSLQPAGGSEDKREVSVTLTASNIQQDSANNVSEIRQTKSETVQIEVTESKGAEQTENAAKVETTKTELTINTAAENNSQNAPKSPKDEKKEDLNPQTLQSPRQSTRRSASPAISRGKMDTVTKMLSKEEEKTKELDAKFAQLNAKKLQLEKALNEKIISQKNAHNKQEEQAKLVSEKDALRKLVEEKKQALKKLIQTRDHQEKEHQRELEAIKNQNNHLQAEIEAKKKADQAKKTEYESKVAHLRNALQAQHEKLAALQSQHKGVQSKIQESSIKATQLTHARQAALQKFTHSQQHKEQQQKAHNIAKENLLKRIAEVKEKINIKKEELTQTKNQSYSHLKEEHERINNEISRAQSESQELAVANKRLEEELTKKSKENNENKELEKKKERKIIDLTKRSEQLTKKAHQFREEVIKLDSQKEEKKVIRYQEKIPEELLAIQAKNDALKKEIKQINERYAAEQAEMNKMVTPQIIQKMNKRISDVIAANQKFAEVTKIIEDVTKENQKLATELDDLEWGENTHLKDLELERKRQQEKNKALEEELQAKKKQLQQLTYKLQQYVKEYPDFKPEKKKKPEPQPEPKGKKEEKGGKKTDKSPPAEENKKKKGNNDSVIEPKVEQAKVEEPKAAGKGKKKKGNSVSQVIEVKDPSPQPVQVKVQKNKVEVKPQVKSEIKSEKKVEEAKSEINQVDVKAEGRKEKKKKK